MASSSTTSPPAGSGVAAPDERREPQGSRGGRPAVIRAPDRDRPPGRRAVARRGRPLHSSRRLPPEPATAGMMEGLATMPTRFRARARIGEICLLGFSPDNASGTARVVRHRSTVVDDRSPGVQTVHEVADRPRGPEHVHGDMLPVLRRDLAFALRFGAALLPDPAGQAPLIEPSGTGRIVAPFGELAWHPEPAQERAP